MSGHGGSHDDSGRKRKPEALPVVSKERATAPSARPVKHFVRDNRSQFIVDRDEHDDEDDKKTLTRTVKRLALVGETSIAHTLSTQPERVAGSNIPNQILELMDYMIAYRYNQSDTERAGRKMTLSKTLMRSSLADKTFAMLVRVFFNSPPAHQLDMSLFVREWKVNGHKGALRTQEWEDAERCVLARLRSHAARYIPPCACDASLCELCALCAGFGQPLLACPRCGKAALVEDWRFTAGAPAHLPGRRGVQLKRARAEEEFAKGGPSAKRPRHPNAQLAAAAESASEPSLLLRAITGDPLRAIAKLLPDADQTCFQLVCTAFRDHSSKPEKKCIVDFLRTRALAVFAWECMPGFILSAQSRVLCLAASVGCMGVLEELADNRYNPCYRAAQGGYLEVLRYAHEHGCPWDSWTCDCAAVGGHLEVLRYAHEHGCLWGDDTCSYAAQGGHLEGGHLEVLRYAHKHGCLVEWERCLTAALENGHAELDAMHDCTSAGLQSQTPRRYLQATSQRRRLAPGASLRPGGT
ncbi:hypothetical protein T492DRAFT_906917 [Pavlovales sp. CCMP2436]|nr:hypothetical protein T492DRAFT_906917 [Pavlovales sp. CCMP2436]